MGGGGSGPDLSKINYNSNIDYNLDITPAFSLDQGGSLFFGN